MPVLNILGFSLFHVYLQQPYVNNRSIMMGAQKIKKNTCLRKIRYVNLGEY